MMQENPLNSLGYRPLDLRAMATNWRDIADETQSRQHRLAAEFAEAVGEFTKPYPKGVPYPPASDGSKYFKDMNVVEKMKAASGDLL